MKYMVKSSKHEAAIPNPALKPFNVLVGEWETVETLLLGCTLFSGRGIVYELSSRPSKPGYAGRAPVAPICTALAGRYSIG